MARRTRFGTIAGIPLHFEVGDSESSATARASAAQG
jgi:hypothetical protein